MSKFGVPVWSKRNYGQLGRIRLLWFGQAQRKDSDDWVSASRILEVNEVGDRGNGGKTWVECVKIDFVDIDLHENGLWIL